MNPGASAFARDIREKTKDGRELTAFMFHVLCGKPIPPQTDPPTDAERRRAASWWVAHMGDSARDLLECLFDARQKWTTYARQE